jgi:hypothetical protein
MEKLNIFKALNREDFLEFFAFIIYCTSIVYVYAVTFCEIPEQNMRNADTCLGFLMGSALTTVLTHLFKEGEKEEAKKSDAE